MLRRRSTPALAAVFTASRSRPALAAFLSASLATSCAAPLNYPDPLGPRYAGGTAVITAPRDTLTVVTFNVAYASHVDRAIEVLRGSAHLRSADILVLQEMDERGTRAIAEALGLRFVYYPSTLHPRTGRDFGNAILSRYPIEGDRKIVLPHRARFKHTIRTAVAATVLLGERRLRVYSVHLGIMAGNGPRARREQLAAVLADADAYPEVVLAGDFNSETVPGLALRYGFTWPTRDLGRTTWFWDMDHVLLKGVTLAGDSAAGVIRRVNGASDHRPVWARVVLAPVRAHPGRTGS